MANKETSLKNIHEIELDILCKCREVCDKHNIPYYLCYGTLLGAVRHEGFIPWDDDIDIMIPADSVPVFKKHFTEEVGEPYFYSDTATENVCLEPWAKIRRSDTTSMPKIFADIDCNWGICIDIFSLYPITSVGCMQWVKKSLFYMAEGFLRASTAKYAEKKSLSLSIASALPYGLRKTVANILLKLLNAGNKNSKYVFDGFMVMKRSDIEGEGTFLSFENENFRVPSEYKNYLQKAYGDYMQLPPESERTGHAADNGTIIWDSEKGYKSYQR